MSLKKKIYPLLPLRDIVIFPHMLATLFVGRAKSIRSIEAALNQNKNIILVAQKQSTVDDPRKDDLNEVGVMGEITQMINLPDGTVKVLIEGKSRVRILNVIEKSPQDSKKPLESDSTEEILPPKFKAKSGKFAKNISDQEDYLKAEIIPFITTGSDNETLYVMDKLLISEFEEHAKLNKKITSEFIGTLFTLEDDEKIIDSISIQLTLTMEERQEILECIPLKERMEIVLFYLKRENETLRMEETIKDRIKSQMSKNHREYYLQEQMKAIQKELSTEEGKDEFVLLEQKIANLGLPLEAKQKVESELKKLKQMNGVSAEATIIRNYVEWILDLPWKLKKSKKFNMAKVIKVLDADHFGLEKVKERILEFLTVQDRLGTAKGQILCLVGPPGVGKTSLARSIAKVTQRPYVRMALGGTRDEAEIRGHRRTYIGAMPGKIIQNMKKAKSTNPLFLLDEIDKLGADWRGDPASALLEVLDPEQNKTFNDHYLEIDYDLSNVMFIATANTLNLPRPLLDRLEIIRLEGYTEEEKLQIALKHLVDKQISENGLKPSEIKFDQVSVLKIIQLYTRESGVRQLEREIAAVCRKALKEIVQDKIEKIHITPTLIEKYLGVPKYQHGKTDLIPLVGITTGLAWTEVGGDILFIESVKSEGKGKVITTGKLGEVMQESIQAALSYIKSRSMDLNINSTLFMKTDLHLHVPEGATPKDGPSAGIGMCTALLSCLTNIPVKSTVAMTGEITLHGKVLPIGGLKEKLLAALRSEIKTVIIPKDNEKDLKDISDTVKNKLEICPVSNMEEVLAIAFTINPLHKKENTQDIEDNLPFSPPLAESHFNCPNNTPQ